jgi:hypothetical protein
VAHLLDFQQDTSGRKNRWPPERANDLLAFKKFIDELLANGGAELKLDEALARWERES